MQKIMLVDNEASILSVLSTVLKVEGYEVKSCREVEKAKEIIRDEDFDLLISDIRMTPLSGMDLLSGFVTRSQTFLLSCSRHTVQSKPLLRP